MTTVDALSKTSNPSAEDRRNASDIVDFFTGPLIWHDIDEETSLMPRLRHRVESPDLESALATIAEQHEQMEDAIERLLPALGMFVSGAASGDVLADLSAKLRAVLGPHLALEERELLPFARMVLNDQDLEDMWNEIQARIPSRLAHKSRAVPLDD